MYRFLLTGLVFCWPFIASAQSSSTIAQMNQDMLLMNEQVGQLRAQVEEMQRQQAKMLKNYEALLKQQAVLTQNMNTFVAQTETKLEALPAREEALKKEISAEVNKQLSALTRQIDATIKQLAEAQRSPAVASPTVHFDENYPQTGYTHTVKSGETISRIAQQYGSSTRDIMNANKIADARTLRVGETIFVPVAQ